MNRGLTGWLLGLVLLMGWLSGCRPATTAPPAATDFACRFSAVYGDLSAEGTLTRRSAGTLELTFSEPATLEGLTVIWDGAQVTFSLYGVQFAVDAAHIPEQALGEAVREALDSVLQGNTDLRREGGTAVLEGTGPAGSYTLVCHGETGYPMTLTVPDLELTVSFWDYT